MTGVEIAGAVGDAMAAILAGVGIWASYGLGDHPEPDNPATRDGVYTKSKTEVLQDLVGIISAIGLAFALLTLVTGDPFGANTSVNLITYLDQKLNALSSPISPAYALCNVGLLILMTFRFYYFNARYLANTYGLNKLEREEWWGFLFPDIPFIMLEGLTFAAVGLVVNHAALFAAGLALGLLMDAFWNVLQLYNCRATLSDVVGPLRFRIDRFWGVGPDKPPYDENQEAAWCGACSAINNLVGGGCLAIMLTLGFVARHPAQRSWSVLAYLELFLIVVLNCAFSIFGYNLRYLVDREM